MSGIPSIRISHKMKRLELSFQEDMFYPKKFYAEGFRRDPNQIKLKLNISVNNLSYIDYKVKYSHYKIPHCNYANFIEI